MPRNRLHNARRQLRRRHRLISVIALYGLVFLAAALYRNGTPNLDNLVEELIFFLQLTALLAVIAVPIYVWRKRQENLALRTDSSFRNRPHLYDRSEIYLVAQVERVLKTDLSWRIRYRLIDTWRRLVASTDRAGRHFHQRFLISSPVLQPGENILVSHNTGYGKVAVRAGGWVEIRGEYIHRRSSVRGLFGRRLSLYGLIHRTHDPGGYVKVLGSKPGEVAEVWVKKKGR